MQVEKELRQLMNESEMEVRQIATQLESASEQLEAKTHECTGADPGFVERGGGAQRLPRAPQARRFWRATFEDPLWNFRRGGARPLRPP